MTGYVALHSNSFGKRTASVVFHLRHSAHSHFSTKPNWPISTVHCGTLSARWTIAKSWEKSLRKCNNLFYGGLDWQIVRIEIPAYLNSTKFRNTTCIGRTIMVSGRDCMHGRLLLSSRTFITNVLKHKWNTEIALRNHALVFCLCVDHSETVMGV